MTAEVADVGADPAEGSWTSPADFPAALRDRVGAVVGTVVGTAVGTDGAPALLRPTGAGHDAGILTGAGVPAAMPFVRDPANVSHSPAEHAERDDRLAGVAAPARVVEEPG